MLTMRCWRTAMLIIATAVSVYVVSGCDPAIPPNATVPGPENSEVTSGIAGHIVMNQMSGEIIAVEIPGLKQFVVRPDPPTNPSETQVTIHALSGPDQEGRIAYIEDHPFAVNQQDRRHLLKTIKLDGTGDTELFMRPGDAMWATSGIGTGRIGADLALSPTRGQIAFLTYLAPLQLPSALLQVGSIEVWDLETKSGHVTGLKALDAGLAWFPDGIRLAYVKLDERRRSENPSEDATSFGEGTAEWGKVPAVYVHDFDADTDSFIHVGWRPAVAADGESVFVANFKNEVRVVDPVTSKSEVVTWRGIPGTAIAIPAKDAVISWGLPTAGSKVKYSENNHELLLTIKIARINSAEFQTVVPYIGRCSPVSFGQARTEPPK